MWKRRDQKILALKTALRDTRQEMAQTEMTMKQTPAQTKKKSIYRKGKRIYRIDSKELLCTYIGTRKQRVACYDHALAKV